MKIRKCFSFASLGAMSLAVHCLTHGLSANYEIMVDDVRDWYRTDSETQPIFIGGTTANTSKFNGAIDDIRIYGRSLSSSEVSNLWTGGNVSSANLLAHWPFNEGSGDMVVDATSNNHDGTFFEGSNPSWVSGKFGPALNLAQSRVKIERSASLQPTQAITLSVWIKPNALGGSRWLFHKYQPSTYGLQFLSNGSKLRFYAHIGSSTHLETNVTASTFTDGDWHLITATYDGATRNVYVDGVLVNSDNLTGNIKYNRYGANTNRTGAYTMAAVDDTLYIGISGNFPYTSNGATLAKIKGDETSLSHAAFMFEQGTHDMFHRNGTLYISGSDPAFDHGHNRGNIYLYEHYTQGPITLKRTLPLTLHTNGIWANSNGDIYTATGTFNNVDGNRNELMKSSDNGDSWNTLSFVDLGDVIGQDGFLYIANYSGEFQYSDNEGASWNTLGINDESGMQLKAWDNKIVCFNSIDANNTYFNIAEGSNNTVYTVPDTTMLISDYSSIIVHNPFTTSSDGYLYLITTDNRVVRVSPPQSGSTNLETLELANLSSEVVSQGLLAITDWPEQNAVAVSSRGSDAKIIKVNKPGPLFFEEGFEALATNSPLNNYNDWVVSGSGTAINQATEAFAGAKSLSISAAPQNSIAALHADDTTQADFVWHELVVKPVAGDIVPTIAPDTSVAYYFNGDGLLTVSDGSNWVNLVGVSPIESTQWVKITIKLNYNSQTYSIWLNGILVGQDLGFANSVTQYTQMRITQESELPAYIDSIRVLANKPERLNRVTERIIPNSEDFESYKAGSRISSQANWDSFGSEKPVITTLNAYTGTQSLEVPFTLSTSEMRGTGAAFDATGESVVWNDFQIAPLPNNGTSDPQINPGSKVVITFRPNGQLRVRNGQAWENLTGAVVADFNEWQRITIKTDHATEKWSVWLNGIRVGQNLDFANNGGVSFFSRLQITHSSDQGIYFDDLNTTLTEPAGLQ